MNLPHCGQWGTEPGSPRCGRPADLILWGKFFPPDALGPRCLAHASDYMPIDQHAIDQWAVFDLRPVRALVAA